MTPRQHFEKIARLAERDGHYAPEAFVFVSDAIGHTQQLVKEKAIQMKEQPSTRGENEEFHVSGKELLEGIRRLAQARWGALAPYVFRRWGVQRTEDFGSIVFLMVEDEEMEWKKLEHDRIEDFENGYDFATAFAD